MIREDLEAVAVLAGKLVRQHMAFDPARFLQLPNPEAGYARYFASELASDQVVLRVGELVAEGGAPAKLVGYAYARKEPRSYNELLDACGKLHDIWVEPEARGAGLGEALVREVFAELRARGAPRVVLLTAVQNASAQRLFTKLGFRTTMLEMTRELEG
jgi:ribosomal protein S18 acetylase RimI-like enzyme